MSGSKSSELRLNVNMNDKCVKDKDEENILFRHSVYHLSNLMKLFGLYMSVCIKL